MPHEGAESHDWRDGPQLIMTGPFNPTGPGDTPSRRAIFTCRPATSGDETGCARKILLSLARRAYRGDMGAADLQVVLQNDGSPQAVRLLVTALEASSNPTVWAYITTALGKTGFISMAVSFVLCLLALVLR